MEPKAAASLTSGLLARKGLARPAMRRQPVTGIAPRPIGSLDDLGWNDMGEDVPAAPAPVAPATVAPSPVAQHIAAIQETLARREEERANALTAKPAPALAPAPRKAAQPKKAPKKAMAQRRSVAADRKSAFTLRIDAERHLRLRLLSAVTNQSAQQLLIGALDALIDRNPHIDALAADPNARPGSTD